ncbi:MAG: hypothetical protein OHK0046_22760 [Anaerolineae bacterium]
MIPDRAGNVESWPIETLVTILLRQFKRLLSPVELTDAEMQALGQQVAARDLTDSRLPALRTVLAERVAESEAVLAQWGLNFSQALATTMADIAGWETTADFLTIANEKINAEIRISAGAALLVALGEPRFAPYLIQAIEHDLAAEGQLDVDATIAKRALLFAAQIDPNAADWLAQARAWAQL